MYVIAFNHGTPETPDYAIEATVAHRYQIVTELLRISPDQIFAEKMTTDIENIQAALESNPSILNMLQRAFPGKQLPAYDQLSDEQKLMFRKFQPDNIYAFLRATNVGLRTTYTDSAHLQMYQAQWSAALPSGGIGPSQFHLDTAHAREAEAVEKIIQFLKQHPGQTIALLYGAGHNFDDDFLGLPTPPRVTNVSYPRAAAELMKVFYIH